VGQAVECLASNHEALSLNLTSNYKKKEQTFIYLVSFNFFGSQFWKFPLMDEQLCCFVARQYIMGGKLHKTSYSFPWQS
jgi:hypothetical protein